MSPKRGRTYSLQRKMKEAHKNMKNLFKEMSSGDIFGSQTDFSECYWGYSICCTSTQWPEIFYLTVLHTSPRFIFITMARTRTLDENFDILTIIDCLQPGAISSLILEIIQEEVMQENTMNTGDNRQIVQLSRTIFAGNQPTEE